MTGIDHKKAELDIRSRFSFNSKDIAKAYEDFLKIPDIGGCVIISTCNRTELWIHTIGHKDISPTNILCDYFDLPADECRGFFAERKSRDAVGHLFRLAAGLESRIVGEGQILTQVGDAVAFARKCYASDNTLEVLFRKAVEAGKRVRTETDFSTADRSVIHAALEKMDGKGFSPAGKKCLVIGNGMMGRIAAQVLMEKGAVVTMTVRKYHRGVVDVPAGCETVGYEERYNILSGQDLVVSATASPNYTLTNEELSLLAPDHIIPVLDLAVPRDVETEVAALPWISLYDIDSFEIDMRTDKLMLNLEKAEKIIEEVKADFYAWKEGRDLIPVLNRLKKHAGEDVTSRMTPYLKRIPLEQDEKSTLIGEIAGASERTLNHLLFALKSNMSDEAFHEMLNAMETVADHKDKEK